MKRRRLVLGAAAIAGAAALGVRYAAGAAAPPERTIRITARRYDYSPSEVTLKKGERVVLELATADVLMGFSVPDLGVREDLIPGKVAQIRLLPARTGTFVFVCDVFCGGGHEEMSGKLIVID